MKMRKPLVGAALATAIGAPIAGFFGDISVSQPTTSTGVRVPFLHGSRGAQFASQAELASLERANEWLNSPPLTASDLRGKVVLIDFWTYTCINWLRTLPYVRAWHEKYRDQGLVVIGVHAPEFSFEKNLRAPRKMATPTELCESHWRRPDSGGADGSAWVLRYGEAVGGVVCEG